MIPELGHFALILGLVLSAVTGASLFFGKHTREGWVETLTVLQCFFVVVSFLALWLAFVTDDFSVAYVANQSSLDLPWGYKATALWGAHEGSMLLWLLILSLWSSCLALAKLPNKVKVTALGFASWLFFGFALFILATSNPFLRFLPIPPDDGAELNPLLQDPAFIIHPPILYLGYVGLSAPFVLILAMLLHQDWQASLLQWIRLATLWSWSFLTLGITLGSWWAYYELGWGGWWFWDPVENASLMPWIASGALLHALRVLQVRQMGHHWVAFLAILGFGMSLLGTFLVRSGVLTSVHAFSSDPGRGAYILIFWTVVMTTGLVLLSRRSNRYPLEFSLWSKEAMMILQSMLMLVALGTVLLGTLYPIVVDALLQEKLSVGPPYFNMLIAPLFLLLLLVLSVGPSLYWRQDTSRVKKYFMGIVVVGVGLGLSLWLTTEFSFYQATILSCAALTLLLTLKGGVHKFHGLRLMQPMVLAHMGLLLTTMGVCLTTALDVEKDFALDLHEVVRVGDYDFQILAFEDIEGPNFEGVRTTVQVSKENQTIATLFPEKRVYLARNMALSETAILPGLLKDIYIALGEPLNKGWSVRIYIKPFVRWIWLGGVLMALAGIWSAMRELMRARVPLKQGVVYD